MRKVTKILMKPKSSNCLVPDYKMERLNKTDQLSEQYPEIISKCPHGLPLTH